MQKQKTIAKWLAVILLVTVAIACYIVLDAIFLQNQNNNQDIADAKQDNAQASDNTTNLPNDSKPVEPILPIYSTLPRNPEKIDNMQVVHIGGEGEDTLLDTIYCFNKTLVVFSTLSEQYDVKQNGIYIGVFDDMTLEKVVRVCDITSFYLAGVQTNDGILIATSDENATTITLYDEEFGITCQNTLSSLKSIKFNTSTQGVTAFMYDGKFLKHATINSSLNATISNHLFECRNLTIASAIQYGTSTILFCNHDDGATVLSYTQNSGFIKHIKYDKQTIEQIMPILQSDRQAYILLTKNEENMRVVSLDSDLKQNAEYTLSNAQNATLYRASNGIEIVTENNIVKLCSHLDFISSTPIEINNENGSSNTEFPDESVKFSSIENCNSILAVNAQNYITIYYKTGNTFRQILKIATKDTPLFMTGKNAKNQEYIKLFFNADSQNSFTYMCFGNFDVFAISLLTE